MKNNKASTVQGPEQAHSSTQGTGKTNSLSSASRVRRYNDMQCREPPGVRPTSNAAGAKECLDTSYLTLKSPWPLSRISVDGFQKQRRGLENIRGISLGE